MKRRLAETTSRIGTAIETTPASEVPSMRRRSGAISCFRYFQRGLRCLLIFCFLISSYHVFMSKQRTIFWDQQETFSVADPQLPLQCKNVATRLNYCQKSKPGVVFACHQTWCNRWGHCELCSGIGDRTRILMSLVQDALDQCIPFQIDSPQMGLAMRDDVVYRDRLGILAELFHYRSYDVTDHRVNVNQWSNQKSPSEKMLPIFVHMTPDKYFPKQYDPCLFHILFRPSRIVQRRLDSYMAAIMAKSKHLIGIHFRSGDLPAFGLTDYKDSRVSNNLELALNKMIKCGETLAWRLFPDYSNLKNRQQLAFFFATDHRDAKELVERMQFNNSIPVFTTNIVPQNYRQREQDVQAWLEIWILSKMKGLVMNVVPKDYAGTAGYVSYFSLLAANIGFINSTQVLRCNV